MTLTRDQRQHLRALGHALDPIVTVGKGGLTDAVVRSAAECFHTRELLKARFRDVDPATRKAQAEELAARVGAELVHVVGKTAVYYRKAPNDARAVNRVSLPAAR